MNDDDDDDDEICSSFENFYRDFKPAAHIIKSWASSKLKILSGLKLCTG